MTTELAERPATPIFSANPTAVLKASREIANVLTAVLAEKGLVKRIGRDEYVLIEGWTLLGSMVGVFAEVEWTRPLISFDDPARVIGFEARAAAKTIDGRQISAAEASCARDEDKWRGREDYALRSMAQTRAISKALRLPLGFIVELAGYSATPAEEVPAEAPAARPSSGVQALRRQIEAAAEERGISSDQLREIANDVGVSERATQPQLRQILDRVLAMDVDDLPEISGNGVSDADDSPQQQDADGTDQTDPTRDA